MAEKVEVSGGGEFDGAILKNAATEATLERVAEALEAKEKGLRDKVLGIFTKTVESNVKAQKESTSAFESFTETAKKGERATSQLFDTFANIAGTTLGTTFSLLTTAGTSLLEFLKNGYTAFQETSDVGAAFNNDLVQLRRVAADALIPLDDFTNIIKKNSESFARLGSNVTEGTRTFSQVAGLLKTEFGDELVGLGFSLRDLNEGAAAYLDTQSRIGRIDNRNTKDLVQGTRDYLLELDKITKLTGASRKAQEEIARKAAVDPIIQSMLDNATDMNKALANISLITKVGGEDTLQMFKEMAAGNPGEEAKMLMSTIGMSMEEARQMFTGDIGVEGVVERMKEYAKRMEAEGLKTGETAEAIMARNPGLAKVNRLLNAFERLGDPSIILKEQQNREKVTEFFGVFSNTLNTIYNNLISGLVNSPVFDELQTKLGELAKIFTDNSGKITEFFQEMIRGINFALDTFIKDMKDPQKSIIGTLATLFKNLFSEISFQVGPIIKDFVSNLFGETPQQKSQREAFRQATPDVQQKMIAENPSLAMPDVSSFFGTMVDGLKSLTSFIPDLSNLGWWLGVTGVGGAIGGIGLSVGLSALAKGLTSISVPALAVGAAIGMGAGGLGLAFKGFSSIIESVGNTLNKIKEFFVGMQDVDSQKLASLGGALKPLSDGISTLMGAGFMSLLTGDSLNLFAVAMQKFNTVDTDKISSIGPALKALYDGVSSFNQGNVFENITASIKSTFSGGTLITIADTITKISNIKFDSTNIATLASFMDALSKFATVNTINVNVTSITETLEQLSKIKNIDFSNINVESLSKSLTDISKIQGINFEALNIDPLFRMFDILIKFKDLTFDNINVDPLVNTFKTLSKVQDISFDNVNIETLITSLDKLTKLKDISFDDTNIEPLSKYFETLSKIQQIKLDNINADLLQNSINQMFKMKDLNFENINLDPLDQTFNLLSKFSSLKFESFDVSPIIDSVNKISTSVKGQELENSLGNIKTTLESFQINSTNIDNAVSAIGKLKTAMSDNLIIEPQGVNEFNKSIQNLVKSLESLEGQMKKTVTPSTVSIETETTNTRRFGSNDISGNAPEDLQKQLNMKMDELISHIVEMKQITKDTSDSISDRRNAV